MRANSLRPLLLLALAASAVKADLGPDVAMELILPNGIVPCFNEIFPTDIRFLSSVDVELSSPTFNTGRTPDRLPAWQISGAPLPATVQLLAGQPQTFPLHMLCNDPTQPIEVRYQVGARSVMQRFYLSPETLDEAVGAGNTVLEPGSDEGPAPQLDRGFALPRPHEPSLEGIDDLRAGTSGAAGKRGYNIRVYGSFVYYRQSHDDDFVYVGDGLQMGADGVTAYVYDSDTDADDLLASTVLGPSGAYDLTFWYDQGEDPDIYVKFVSANGKVELSKPGQNVNYSWKTTTKEDFTGTTINFGKRWPGNDEHYAGLNLLATCSRAWRWLNAYASYGNIDRVEISWPDSDWPHYKPIFETIYIPDFRQWNEGTIVHEYGHHWQQEYTDTDGTDYCNAGGRCDEPGSDCRHCAWCMETGGDAIQEGFPNWMSAMCTQTFPAEYGFAAIITRSYESVQMCSDTDPDMFDPANLVEGNISAFLQDVCDNANDDDPNGLGGADELSLSNLSVFQAQDIFDPITSTGLIDALRIQNPSLKTQIWRTAKNNRFELVDNVAPSTPADFTSTSHLTVGEDPDSTVDLIWDASTDDYSGISGYRMRVSTSPSGSNPTFHTSPTNAWTSPDLAPATYYFFVSAYDGDLNYSGEVSFGPVTIREWIPSDVENYAGIWTYPIIPNNNGTATPSLAPLQSVLIGNTVDTYISVRIHNSGELMTTPTLKMYIYLDGLLWGIHNIMNLPPLAELAYMNMDPYPIPGGRHALGTWLDATELMAEPDEIDNRYSRQFIWSPLLLSGSGWVTRDDAPAAYSGFTPGIFASANCDGFNYVLGTSTFMGVVMLPVNASADYDLNLHDPYTSSTSGFGYFDRVATSFRPAGHLDAVFTNNSLTSTLNFNAGVTDYTGSTGDFQIRRLTSTQLGIGGTTQVTIPAADHIVLRHFSLAGDSGPNWATLTLDSDPANGTVHASLIEPILVHTGLDDGAWQLTSDENGRIRVNFPYTASLHGLVIWQDPAELSKQAVDFEVAVKVEYMKPDLAPLTSAGWAAPIVPSTNAPGTPASAPAPALLVGNSNTTYLNVQFKNQGYLDAILFDSINFLDGVAVAGEQILGVAGFSNWIKNFSYPIPVRGGRHTLSMFPDSGEGVLEDSEANNRMGNQWVWSPIVLADSGLLNRTVPPDPYGGYAEVVGWNSQLFWPNCDGMRTTLPTPIGNDGHWVAVAAMPGAASDVDVRLHEKGTGTTSGFRTPRAVSAFGMGLSDYVLMNFRETMPREFEVGVTAVSGSEDFVLDQTRSVFLAVSPSGIYQGFTLAADELVDLHEVTLDAGFLSIAVEQSDPASADIDWGLTLHMSNLPYQSKSSSASVVAEAWGEPAGWRESLVVDVPVAGTYCLAVWKATSADLALAAPYKLQFTPTVTASPQLPTVTALQSIQPNPFNPATRIAFDLAERTRVQLDVFDVRGRRVRRLVDELLPAGRHERLWDGRDDAGHVSATGTYFASLVAGDRRDVKKMVLVK